MSIILHFLFFQVLSFLMLLLFICWIKINPVFLSYLTKLVLFFFKDLFLLLDLLKKLINMLKLLLLFSQLIFGDSHFSLKIIDFEHRLRRTIRQKLLHLNLSLLLINPQLSIFLLKLLNLILKPVQLLMQRSQEIWILHIIHPCLNSFILNHHIF